MSLKIAAVSHHSSMQLSHIVAINKLGISITAMVLKELLQLLQVLLVKEQSATFVRSLAFELQCIKLFQLML